MARTWNVPPGGNLQTAINDAAPGDTILLQPGATYTGPFRLRRKPPSSIVRPITIRSAASAKLSGVQWVGPEHVSYLARVVAPGYNVPAFDTEPAANNYRLTGLEVLPVAPQAEVNELILLGDTGQNQDTLDKVPYNFLVEKCYLHGWPGYPLKRGISLQSRHTTIRSCSILECKGEGYDTQAICGWNTPGNIVVEDCLLEAAGENMMIGGADPSIPDLIPTNIVVRRCLMQKPLSWRGSRWSVKNIFELKSARKVTVKDCHFRYCWEQSQVGFAIVLTSVNQDGRAPWSVVEDVLFANNIVQHAGGGINMNGRNGNTKATNKLLIENNFFSHIDAQWGGRGDLFQMGECHNVTLRHNTGAQSGNLLTLHGEPSRMFVMVDNVFQKGAYGIKGSGTGEGNAALDTFCPGWRVKGNVIVGASAAHYPPDNFYPETVNFMANGELDPDGPYRTAGSDGRMPGVRMRDMLSFADVRPG